MGVLEEIAARKRERLALAMSRRPLRELKSLLADMAGPSDFASSVRRHPGAPIRLIAEVKKASPSRGLIREDFDPASIARIYDRLADAISVITEEDFFRGSLGFIAEVKSASARPVLRKDFVLEEYQIYESRAAGADAVLLIERLLERRKAEEFLQMARELGMAALFEVHDERGAENALLAGAGIIGINNRDLETLRIDVETTFRLKRRIPEGVTVVSESGIRRRDDVTRIEAAGVDAVLVGTVFMEAEDIDGKIKELTGRTDLAGRA